MICENRRARRDYDIDTTLEAGLMLLGTEIKAIRDRRVNMADAYATFRGNELYLVHLDIAPFDKASRFNHESKRERKLLLHRRELEKLSIKIKERGFTLIPLDLHFKDGRVKVTLALARGRKNWDDRREIRAEQERRELRDSAARRH